MIHLEYFGVPVADENIVVGSILGIIGFRFYRWVEDSISVLKALGLLNNPKKELRLSTLQKLVSHLGRLRSHWPSDKLTKPIAFVVDNADWTIRYSLLSTPLVPALCMGSRDLL